MVAIFVTDYKSIEFNTYLVTKSPYHFVQYHFVRTILSATILS